MSVRRNSSFGLEERRLPPRGQIEKRRRRPRWRSSASRIWADRRPFAIVGAGSSSASRWRAPIVVEPQGAAARRTTVESGRHQLRRARCAVNCRDLATQARTDDDLRHPLTREEAQHESATGIAVMNEGVVQHGRHAHGALRAPRQPVCGRLFSAPANIMPARWWRRAVARMFEMTGGMRVPAACECAGGRAGSCSGPSTASIAPQRAQAAPEWAR